MNAVIVTSIGTAVGLYLLVAFTGYMSYGNPFQTTLTQVPTCQGTSSPCTKIPRPQHSDGLPLSYSCYSPTHYKPTLVVVPSTKSSRGVPAAPKLPSHPATNLLHYK